MNVPGPSDARLRAAVYRSFAETGRPPAVAELAARFGTNEAEIRASLERLAADHHLALLPDGEVWMANPFSAVETPYSVETPRMRTFAPCAWDAWGVPAILECDATVRTRCAGSGEPLTFGVRDGARVGDDGVIHMVVPIRDAWANIGYT